MQPGKFTQEVNSQKLLDDIERVIMKFAEKRQVRKLQQIIENQKYFYEYTLCLEGKMLVEIVLILEESDRNLFIKLKSELKKVNALDLSKVNNSMNLEFNPCLTIYSNSVEKTVEARFLISKEKIEIDKFSYQEILLKDLEILETQLKSLLVYSLNTETTSSQSQKPSKPPKIEDKKKDQLLKKLAGWIVTWKEKIKEQADLKSQTQSQVKQQIINFNINPSIQTKPITLLQSDIEKKQLEIDKILKACADKPPKQEINNRTIVKTISIIREHVDEEWKSPCKNNFGLVQRMMAKYKLMSSSLHQRVSQKLETKVEKQCEGYIVKKSPISESMCAQDAEKSVDSFRTEVWAIFYLRAEGCPQIAQYYFTEVTTTFSQLQFFYLKWYNSSFSTYLDKKTNPKIILHIFKGIIQCLKFLAARNLCHRDLKFDNVLIGENFIPKIIDFGSASLSYGNKIHNTLSGKLRSTRGYYCSPHQIVDEKMQEMIIKQAKVDLSGMDEEQKQEEFYEIVARDKKFDIYSLGAMLERWLQNDGRIKENIFVFKKIVEMAKICRSVSPLNRPSADSILIYWKLLLKYWETASSRQ